jgi:NAD(P)H-dependent nitrite reductase small subunit
MTDFVKVAQVADVPPGQGKLVLVNDREIALFNLGGRIFAIDNICPHRGGPLAEGVLEGNTVICPWHGWRFDVTTGQNPIIPPARVDTFEVKVEGDDIFVKV